MKKYTLEEIKSMFPKDNFFAFGTPLGTQADKHAFGYDYESDTLNCEEAVRDAFVYGAHWVINHLK